jgi:prophage regulatory protein
MSQDETHSLAILRRRSVEERTGLARSTIYRRMRDGTFPPSISLGGRIVGWRVAEIELFLVDPSGYTAPTSALHKASDKNN